MPSKPKAPKTPSPSKRKGNGVARSRLDADVKGSRLSRKSLSGSPKAVSEDRLAQFKGWLSKVSRALSSTHEHVSPKFTEAERNKMNIAGEYGGITGTIQAASMFKLFKAAISEVSREFRMSSTESVFLDVGCGTGRPVFYACDFAKFSIGFDVDPMQVFQSAHATFKLDFKQFGGKNAKAPIAFFHGDVRSMKSLSPCSHVFAFLGYSSIVERTARLVAISDSVKVFMPIVLHRHELTDVGFDLDDDDVIKVSGLAMPAGNSYTGYVIPMTTKRRDKVLETTTTFEESSSSEAACNVDLDRIIDDWTIDGFEARKSLLARLAPTSSAGPRRNPRRAASSRKTN